MDESSIRMLIRIDSQKHLKNLKAELNRLMNRIYEGNVFVDPLKTKIDDLHDSTRGRSPASTWLVDAAALYKSLQQEYNSNGRPKN